MKEIPPSHSTPTFTDTSFLLIAAQSIEIRNEICRKVNDLKDSPDRVEALEYEDAIRQHIASLPRWSEPRSVQARTLLELQLRELVLIVHAPRVLQFESRRISNCRYSMVAALEAATRTIDLHYSLSSSENYALVLTRDDYFHSALLICHVAYHARRNNGALPYIQLLFQLTHARHDHYAPSQNLLRRLHGQSALPARTARYAPWPRLEILLVS